MYLCQAHIDSHRTHRYKMIQAKRYLEHKFGRMVGRTKRRPNKAERLRRFVGYLMPRLDFRLDFRLQCKLEARLEYWPILHNLSISQTILDHLGPSQTILVHLRPNLTLSQTISYHLRPSQTISDHLKPFLTTSNHLRLSLSDDIRPY